MRSILGAAQRVDVLTPPATQTLMPLNPLNPLNVLMLCINFA
jgi:hypothetical protein